MNAKIETIRDSEGNTISSESTITKQPLQLKNWFFTYNNYKPIDIEILENKFNEVCIKYCFQEEMGEITKTKHLQGVIILKEKMRYTELGLSKRIHWEKVKCIEESFKYCCKTESRNGVVKCKNYKIPVPLKCLDELLLRPFQKDILNMSLTEPDGRSIHWFVDDIGNTGKSAFCRFMAIKYNAFVIQGGKLSDIMNMIFNTDMDLVNSCIIDIPRINKGKVSYASIECILNGMISNTKYETGRKIFNPPHVFILSNFYPDLENLSKDRWKVYEIDNLFKLNKVEIDI